MTMDDRKSRMPVVRTQWTRWRILQYCINFVVFCTFLWLFLVIIVFCVGGHRRPDRTDFKEGSRVCRENRRLIHRAIEMYNMDSYVLMQSYNPTTREILMARGHLRIEPRCPGDLKPQKKWQVYLRHFGLDMLNHVGILAIPIVILAKPFLPPLEKIPSGTYSGENLAYEGKVRCSLHGSE